MIKERLENHIKLCRRNLRSERVVCCASCPFENDILSVYPELKMEFSEKRAFVKRRGKR